MERELKDVETKEVSVVSSPATKKKFLFWKQEGVSMEELVKLIKELTDEDLSSDEIEKAKALTDEQRNALKGALNMLNKYKSDLPADLKEAISTLSKYAVGKYPAPKPYKKEEVGDKAEDKTIEKAGSVLSKGSISELEKAMEIIQSLLAKAKKKPDKDEECEEGKYPAPKPVKKDEAIEKKESGDMYEALKRLLAEHERAEKEKEADKEESEIQKQLSVISESLKIIPDIAERLKKIEDTPGIKKSLDDIGDEKEVEKKTDEKWPSFTGMFDEEE